MSMADEFSDDDGDCIHGKASLPRGSGSAIDVLGDSGQTQLVTSCHSSALPPSPRETRAEPDLPRIQRAVREILSAIGENPDREGLQETPARVARMFAELTAGLRCDPARHLERVFPEQYDELVLVKDISFNSMCEHHLLPFMGVAHIGYLPRGKVVGLSKLARIVDEISHQPQVQERMTQQIADLMQSVLDPKGVIVVLEATHTCMTIRGIRKPGSLTITSAVRGLFKTNQASRAEVMSLMQQRRSV